MSNFHIGQRVVCIAPHWHPRDWRTWFHSIFRGHQLPKYREVYTIAAIICEDDLVYLRLMETADPDLFSARAFRPLVEKSNEASMSIFRKMLEPKKELV